MARQWKVDLATRRAYLGEFFVAFYDTADGSKSVASISDPRLVSDEVRPDILIDEAWEALKAAEQRS